MFVRHKSTIFLCVFWCILRMVGASLSHFHWPFVTATASPRALALAAFLNASRSLWWWAAGLMREISVTTWVVLFSECLADTLPYRCGIKCNNYHGKLEVNRNNKSCEEKRHHLQRVTAAGKHTSCV